jgi:hypothetical protein
MSTPLVPWLDESPTIHMGGVLPLAQLVVQSITNNIEAWHSILDFGSLSQDLVLLVLKSLRRSKKLHSWQEKYRSFPISNAVIHALVIPNSEERLSVYLQPDLTRHLTALDLTFNDEVKMDWFETEIGERLCAMTSLQTLVLDFTQAQVDSIRYLPPSVRQLSMAGAGSFVVKGMLRATVNRTEHLQKPLRLHGMRTVVLAPPYGRHV